MFELNTAGYDLYEVGDLWFLHVKGGSVFSGTFYKVARHAISVLGFKATEIEEAIGEMTKNGHNGAHFGMYKGFIFSFNKEFKSVKRAS